MTATQRDYYEILGLAKGASSSDIKRAYRKLAMQYHPDRVQAADKKAAEEKFKEISEAYAVLSDEKKRSVYDQYGHAGFDQRYSTEDIFRGADFSSIFEDLGFGGGGGGSIFEDLLGGLFGGGVGSRASRGTRGADLETELVLTFEEAAKQTHKTVTLQRRELCGSCRGQGGDRTICGTCKGAGQVQQSAGFMMIARPCPNCSGAGSTVTKPCNECRGQGRVRVQRKIDVTVPAGVESGMRLRLSGEGEAGSRARGDLYVFLTVQPHPLFERNEADLLLDFPINFAQASLGIEVEVPTLTGRVSMKIPAGTQSGKVFRVRGQGLPRLHDRGTGDLLVRVIVETPTRLNASQKKLMEEMASIFGDAEHPSHGSFVKKLKGWFKK